MSGSRPSDLSFGHQVLGMPSLSDWLIDGTYIPGNKITDFAAQTSTVGIPIPFGYGVIIVNGNVIWVDEEVKTHVKKVKQGKGGTRTEEYTYTRSYAIGFAQGLIYDYLIITRNGKVVFTRDPRAPAEDQAFSVKWQQNVAMYLGTNTQMPDSTIEAVEGVGQVSAFRDLAYIVVENDDVTDTSGAVPSYQAIILASPPAVFMTSRPYAIEDHNAFTSNIRHLFSPATAQQELLESIMSLSSGTLQAPLIPYDDWPPEAVDSVSSPSEGTLDTILLTYDDWPPEAVDSVSSPSEGTLEVILITYDRYPPEAVESIASGPSEGTLV